MLCVNINIMYLLSITYSKLFAAYTPVIVIVIVIQYEFHNSLNALHNSLITLHNSCNSMQCVTHIVYPEESHSIPRRVSSQLF